MGRVKQESALRRGAVENVECFGTVFRFRWITVLVALILMPTTPLSAFQVASLNLGQMSAHASRIIVGTCMTKKEKVSHADGLVYTEYTFSVSEVIKGGVGQTVTVRQAHLGRKPSPRGSGHHHDSPSGSSGDGVYQQEPGPLFDLVPMPEYLVGQEVMLFLTGESDRGFSSPITLEQAVFDIQAEPRPSDVPVRGTRKQIMSRVGEGLLFMDMSAQKMAASRRFSESELSIFPTDTETPGVTGQNEKRKEKLNRKKGVFPYEDFVSVVKKLSDSPSGHPKGGRK